MFKSTMIAGAGGFLGTCLRSFPISWVLQFATCLSR